MNRRTFGKFLAMSSALIASSSNSAAQSELNSHVSSQRRWFVAPELPELDEDWVANSLEWADLMFRRFPPSLPEQQERRPALQRVDDIMHMTHASRRGSVQRFLRTRFDSALDGLEGLQAEPGVQVWKLYDAGFIIRDQGQTVGFDIVAGVPGTDCQITDRQLYRLIAQVDLFFISHEHPDHADPRVVREASRQGKKTIGPPGLWSDRADGKLVNYATRDPEVKNVIPIGAHKSVKVTTFAGHQGIVLNNVYLVEWSDGAKVLHMGDQDEPVGDDLAWLSKIDGQQPDILLVDNWYADPAKLVSLIKPGLIIPGHENELSHSVDHREDYAKTYERFQHLPTSFVVMTWGETFSSLPQRQLVK